MNRKISVGLSSPPDRPALVADLMVDQIQLAEVCRGPIDLQVEFFNRPDTEPWVVPLTDLRSALSEAERRLQENADPSDR